MGNLKERMARIDRAARNAYAEAKGADAGTDPEVVHARIEKTIDEALSEERKDLQG